MPDHGQAIRARADNVLSVRSLNLEATGNVGAIRLVDNVDLSVRQGECVAIVGESGSGKTISTLAGVGVLGRGLSMVSGSAELVGQDLAQLSNRDLLAHRGRNVGVIPQDPLASLDPVRTIGSQIAEPARIHLKLSRREARERTLAMMREVSIPDPEKTIGRYPHQLSGGQRQRVLIAQALMCNPKLVIADEATSALDVTLQSQVIRLLSRERTRRDLALIFITHDLELAAEIADRIVVMYAGSVVEHGAASDVVRDPSHPYTAGLIAAQPHAWSPGPSTMSVIPGNPPTLSEGAQVPGCQFAPRCAFAQHSCTESRPPLEPHGRTTAACFFPISETRQEAVPR